MIENDNISYSENCNETIGDESALFSTRANKGEFNKHFTVVIFALILGMLLAFPYILDIFAGKWLFSSKDEFMKTMYAFVIFFPMAIIVYKKIKFNKVVITNEEIFIHNGAIGTLVSISVIDLKGYYLEWHSSRGWSSSNINLWCKSGARIRSDSLYLDEVALEKFAHVLEQNLNLPVLRPVDILKSGGSIKTGRGRAKFEINYNSLFVTMSPFVVSFILACVYYLT